MTDADVEQKDNSTVQHDDSKTPNDAPAEKPADQASERPDRDVFVPPPSLHDGIESGIPGFAYSPVSQDEEFKATAGTPLEPGAQIADKATVIEALQTVFDPEIPVNIYDLGLIYSCKIADNGDVDIAMSLTAPGCPVAGEMPGMVARAVETVEGVGEIEVRLVWEPQWSPALMSEDAKLALGMG